MGLIFAPFSVGPFSHYLRPRYGYWVGSVFSVARLLIRIFITSKGPVYVSRFLLGFGNSIYVTATVLYCSEVAPVHLRGIIVAMFKFTQNIGGLLSAIIDNYTAKMLNLQFYQIPMAVLVIIPVFLSTLMFFIPESRWLTVTVLTIKVITLSNVSVVKSSPENFFKRNYWKSAR